MRIGICDDNEKARRTVADWLKTRSDVPEETVYEFSCGEALLEHLRRFTLDIVFLDCRMEGLDGIETAEAIRCNDSRIIIILLTDFTNYARLGYNLDILDFILKNEFEENANRVFDKAVLSIRKAYYLCENTVEFKVIRLGKCCLKVHKESFDQWLDALDNTTP